MNKKAILITLAIIVIPIILMGCGSREPATPTTTPDLVYTAAAQAAEATLTQIFKSTPSATQLALKPTRVRRWSFAWMVYAGYMPMIFPSLIC